VNWPEALVACVVVVSFVVLIIGIGWIAARGT
jgi:hypothetical protein